MENEPKPAVAEDSMNNIKEIFEKRLAEVRSVLASKKTLWVLVIIFLVGSVFYLKEYLVVATVNGEPISRLSIVHRLEKQGGRSVLDSMITEKLIENEAKKQGITVTAEELDQEIASIEESIASQGTTLEDALMQQGMSMEDLKKSIQSQKTLSKLLGDKVKVTDEEVEQYMQQNQASIPAEQVETIRPQIVAQLENQKLSEQASAYIEELRAKAKIQFYKEY